jgi:uncharacterized protein (TIGR02001 family)
MRPTTLLLGTIAVASATPAFAQDSAPPPAVKLSGGATLTSDYRFRGVTRSDGDPSIQATLDLDTRIGLYAGTSVSEIDGSGRTPAIAGHGDAEVDLYGGYATSFSNGIGVDVGLLYYVFPGRAPGRDTNFFEPYAALRYTLGPVSTKLGATYAWGGQQALGGLDATGGNGANIYVYGDASVGIPRTPVTLKTHLGYSNGSLGSLNPAGSNDDSYYDWSVTAEAVGGPMKVGISYVDTDITNAKTTSADRQGFASKLGRGSTMIGYIGFSF